MYGSRNRCGLSAAQLTDGPVYSRVDRWGHVGESELHIDSIAPLLRTILANGGLSSADLYSGHSLRRGFANWAVVRVNYLGRPR